MPRLSFYYPLLTLLLSLPSQAAQLELADNLTLLASSQGKPSAFSRVLDLPAGETKLLVRFDSPSDPNSTNESPGRITSAPLLVTIKAPAQGTLRLVTPALATAPAIRQFAVQPTLLLTNMDGSAQPLTQQVLPRNQDTLRTDYQALLASYQAPAPSNLTPPTVTRQQPSATPPRVATEEPAVQAPAMSVEQADAELRRLYLAADEARRKAFIRWALDL
ncbi:DUF2057 family protein [Aeromonas cavernicola]|uniref:DUF2057 domain-containing protein n=1 Tax=Aeromonas cavernicola TaxID=1006623 RepID=A0A2H9U2B5_9GAMM|nr:DUF2057 family protein [Aeromonas cavernicola]PJG58140.1 DUF2057 domain-containing protein [Aeromonas cavernicola]